MSNSIAFKRGPFHYAEPADCQPKVFEDGQGGKRTFTLIVASAYNAGGLIGTERNGLAMLDEDQAKVVFDEVGPRHRLLGQDLEAQRRLLRQFMEADWPQFNALIREHASSRLRDGAMQDLGAPAPAYVQGLSPQENWAVDIAQDGPADDPYTYPAKTREAVIAELLRHKVHRDGYGPWRLAWDIKVGSFDETGHTSKSDEPLRTEFDDQWKQALAQHGEQIWQQACEDGLQPYLPEACRSFGLADGLSLYATDEDDQGDYGFGVEGRSGGWLVLDQVKGVGTLRFADPVEMKEALMGMDQAQLLKLYRVVCHLDHDLTAEKIAQEMSYQYAVIRAGYEERWEPELEAESSAASRP